MKRILIASFALLMGISVALAQTRAPVYKGAAVFRA
jgi:hypothetical protein